MLQPNGARVEEYKNDGEASRLPYHEYYTDRETPIILGAEDGKPLTFQFNVLSKPEELRTIIREMDQWVETEVKAL